VILNPQLYIQRAEIAFVVRIELLSQAKEVPLLSNSYREPADAVSALAIGAVNSIGNRASLVLQSLLMTSEQNRI
jgi:hypothetical protein